MALTLILSAAFFTPSKGQILVNPSNGTGTQNGTTWATGYATIQAAIHAAQPGDTIWVMEGSYQPQVRRDPNQATSATLYIDKSLHLYGGFVGTESSLSQRDTSRRTTLDGGSGFFWQWLRCLVTIEHPGAGTLDVTLSGFGFRDAYGANASGSAITLRAASQAVNLTLERCHMTQLANDMTSVYCDIAGADAEGNIRVLDSHFEGLESNGDGGAFHFYSRNASRLRVEMVRCFFARNVAYRGGAWYVDADNIDAIELLFRGCSFVDNGFGDPNPMTANSQTAFGGVYAWRYAQSKAHVTLSRLHFQRCIFKGNRAQQIGAISFIDGIVSNRSAVLYENCWMEGHQGNTDGISSGSLGGVLGHDMNVALDPGAAFVDSLVGCVMYNNTNLFFDLEHSEGLSTVWLNNTAYNNDRLLRLSTLHRNHATLHNNIVWGSRVTTPIVTYATGTPDWKLQQGIYHDGNADGSVNAPAGFTVTQVTEVDPQWVNTANPYGADGRPGTADDGLQLATNSPARDAGDTTGYNLAAHPADMAYAQRLTGTQIDMGAYEYGSTALPVSWLAFTARRAPWGVILQWTTATEENNAGFEILRSSDARTWSPIGYVVGGGTRLTPQQYDFSDAQPLTRVTYYRLRQLDYDGTAHYSPITTVTAASTVGLQLYPNPVRETLYLQGLRPGFVQVVDGLGRTIWTHHHTADGDLPIATHDWPAGRYWLRHIDDQGEAHVRSFVVWQR